MKTQLNESLKQLRTYESETHVKWGNRKRIFRMVGVEFEIKFCRAEMMLQESLQKDIPRKQLQMIEMMIRAFDSLNIKCEESGYIRIQPNVKCFNFDKKTALVCDLDEEKPLLAQIHKDEKDMIIFSIEELFRCIPQDFMEAKAILSKLDKTVNFKRIDYGQGK